MSTSTNDIHEEGRPMPELDAMLSRAVAGDREALRWVRERGATDPAILEELALWQADELRLVRAARALDARAAEVGLPGSGGGLARGRGGIVGAAAGGLGWAIAAVLVLAWLGQIVAPGAARTVRGVEGGATGAQTASFGGAFASSDEAFDAYLAKAREEGVVIGDVAPPVLVGSRELVGGGGFEVIVVRQVYERRRAPELYRLAPVGESGRLRPIAIRPRTETVQ